MTKEKYAYDATGSRVSDMNNYRGIEARDFTYSAEDHLLVAGSDSFQFDLDGFLVSKADTAGTTQYQYSSQGELLSVRLTDGTSIEYVHDPLGRRIAKKVNGILQEKYLWQGQTRLLAVFDESDRVVARFEYADGRVPMSLTSAGSTYYLAYDPIGSLRLVADGAGNVIKRLDYDAFGNIIADSNPDFNVWFGFAGGLHDRDIDLIRFGHRDYDPNTGRWTAKDPIFFNGGDTDLYGYCLNDPINGVDPDGKVAVFGMVVGGISGTIGGFTAGMIDGNGDLSAAVAGGFAGGVVGALVGSINVLGSSAAGQAMGSIVGGTIGGSIGAGVSSSLSQVELNWNLMAKGALAGGISAAIASPGVLLAYIGSSGSPLATGLAGANGGVMGDLIVSTGISIYNHRINNNCAE